MSYTTIAAQIVSLLEEITEISIVYNHEPSGELSSYPAATVKSLGHQNVAADTAANKRKFSFRIRCYYNSTSAQEAEELLRTIADLIISKFESNPMINNTCDYSTPTSCTLEGGTREIPTAFLQFTIDAYKRVNR